MAVEMMETEAASQIKRKGSETGSEKMQKKPRKKDHTGKNAMQVLSEEFSHALPISFDFEFVGNPQAPSYKAIMQLEGVAFEGEGQSKMHAKKVVASKALAQLRSIFISPDHSHQKEHKFSENASINFTTNEFIGNFKQEDGTADLHRPVNPTPSKAQRYNPFLGLGDAQEVPQEAMQLVGNIPKIDIEKAQNHPIMVLNEVFRDAELNWCEGYGRGDHQFKVETEIQGRKFFGEGRSKAKAKMDLSKTILKCLYDVEDFIEVDTLKPVVEDSETAPEKKFPLTQLKEIFGKDEVTVEVVQVEGADEDSAFHATVLAKGSAYEAVGKNKISAKLKAAKIALNALRPRKDSNGSQKLNEAGVDVSIPPLAAFNAEFKDAQFEGSESFNSTAQRKEYTVSVTVNGCSFSATASNKKNAKLRAVLKTFEQLKKTEPTEWLTIDLDEIMTDKQSSPQASQQSPIVLLLKLCSQTKFDVTEDINYGDAAKRFKAIVKIGDAEFVGEGPNKKIAKADSARAALIKKFGINPDEYVKPPNRLDYLESDSDEPPHESSPELCDRVAKAVAEKFNEVFTEGTSPKVLASFVLAKYDDPNGDPMLEVISIGTGTKCVTGETVDHKGQTLNDCHGEIIACRGFRQFLFDELMLAMKKDPSSILQPRGRSGKYQLKSNLKVFLFINTAPCGDGRVFSISGSQKGANNKTVGVLRTKIENGQGTIPVPENSIQTSDGILEGERLRTMSCSDKILKWNILGVQGALLSYFLDPVYLYNTVIGLHYHYHALYRSLYKRACQVEKLPTPYIHNKPYFGKPGTFELARNTAKSTSNSFNWYYRAENIEAVNATTGQTMMLGPSRLCKLQFFDKFNEVLKLAKRQKPPKTYHAGKMLAKDYQQAKEAFFNAICDTTGGKWMGKPYEHDMFGY